MVLVTSSIDLASGSAQQSQPGKFLPQSQRFVVVQFKKRGSRTARWRFSDDAPFIDREMIGPMIPARVKQRCYLSCAGINASEGRALVAIAFRAGEREIADVIRAAMLTGHNVLDVKAQSGEFLRQMAILATVSGTLPNHLPRHRIHQAVLARTDLASSLRTPSSVLSRTSEASSSRSAGVSCPSVFFSASES